MMPHALVRGLMTVGLLGLAAAPLVAQTAPAAVRPVVVRVAVSGHAAPHASVLHHPERILVEWFGTTLAGPPRKFAIGERGVSGVRLWSSRDTVRLVVDLSRAQPFAIAGDDSTTSVYIGVSHVPPTVVGAASPRPAAPAAVRSGPASSGSAPVASVPAAASPRPGAPAPRSVAAVQPRYRPVAPLLAPNQVQPIVARPSTGLIDVEFSNTDLRDAIQSFADFSGRSIVAGTRVQGKVSAKITQKPWRSALTEILSANGFAVEDGADGILRVDEEKAVYERQRYEPLATRIVRVNYVKPTALVPMVTATLSRDCGIPGAQTAAAATAVCVVRGSVSAEESTNSLSITELPSHMDAVVSYVHNLDIRTQQVKIRAKLIFVDRSRLDELGLAYDVGTASQYSNKLVPRADPASPRIPVDRNGDGVPDGSVPSAYQSQNTQVINLGGRALTGLANADYRVGSPAISLVASTVFGGYSVTSFIDALQQQSMGDLQAEPTVTTLSNHTASILVGDETPIRVVDASAGGSGSSGGTGASGPPRATVSFKETGIILEVTPTVTDNGQVVMKIHAERSSVQLASSDVGVSFSKQRGDATLLLNNKETAAIGGLTVTNKSESHTGIPVLMDLPLVGRFFRQTRQLVSKQDLLILVTPEIVQDHPAAP